MVNKRITRILQDNYNGTSMPYFYKKARFFAINGIFTRLLPHYRHMMQITPIPIVLTAFIAFSNLYADYGVVKKVIDGDTIAIRSKNMDIKCRLKDIDTPEKRSNVKLRKDVGDCSYLAREEMKIAGKYATIYARDTLPIGVRIKYSVHGHDRYGRALCLIYAPNGKLFNLLIVRDGFAIPYYKYIKDRTALRLYEGALQNAKKKRLGSWKTVPHAMQCLYLQRRKEVK